MLRIVFALLTGLLLCAQTPLRGFPPGTFQSRAALDAAGGGGGPTTTWNSLDKSASVTLSGGNLTATNSSTSSYAAVRGVASHSSGKYYWEDTLNASPTGGVIVGGFANASMPLSAFIGQDNNSVGYTGGSGFIFQNGAAATTIQTAVNGDIVGYALDLGNQKFWVRTIHLGVAGNWNNSGTDNPATNTGGFSFAGLAAGPYLPAAALNNANANNAGVTTNFGGSAFAASAPSGFGNW